MKRSSLCHFLSFFYAVLATRLRSQRRIQGKGQGFRFPTRPPPPPTLSLNKKISKSFRGSRVSKREPSWYITMSLSIFLFNSHLDRSSMRFFSRSSFSFFFLSALSRASLLRSLASFLDLLSALCLLSISAKWSLGSSPSGILLRWVMNSFQWLKRTRKTVIWRETKKNKQVFQFCIAYVQGGGQSSLVFSTVLLRHSGTVPLQFLYLCLSEDVRMNWRIPPREPFHQFVSHLNRNIDLQFRSNSRVQKTVYDGLNFALN